MSADFACGVCVGGGIVLPLALCLAWSLGRVTKAARIARTALSALHEVPALHPHSEPRVWPMVLGASRALDEVLR